MATNLKLIPRAERLLEGKITDDMTDSQLTVTVDNPPLITALPAYLEIDPDSTTYRELCRVIAVSSSTITLERGLNNGGTGFQHPNNTAYKFKFTSRHWEAVATAMESGYLTEDPSYAFTKVSTSSFKITASTVDRTDLYTTGRKVRINGSVLAKIISSSYSSPDTTVVINAATVPDTITSVEIAITTKGDTDDLVDKTSNQTVSGKTNIQRVTSQTPTGIGTTTLDLSTGNIQSVTMPAATQTLAISNATVGQCFLVEINNVTSQGALTWFTTIRWVDGTAPTLTGTNGKRDVFGFRVTGSGTYDGYVVGQNI